MKVKYEFALRGGARHEFEIDIERSSSSRAGGGADWTRLAHEQCSNCPLSRDEHRNCPAAFDLERVITAFGQVVSYDSATVHVHVNDRIVSKETDVESALVALLGLVMASSGCPILAQLKGMARMHTPFQRPDEAMLRFVGSYCIGQLIAMQDRQQPDWSLKPLEDLFEDLIKVNQAFRERIRGAAERDSATSAIMHLATQTMGTKFSVADHLEDLQPYVVPLPPESQ